MEKASSKRKYRILRDSDNRLLARVETLWAFVNFKTMKLERIPAELVEAFRQAGAQS